MEHERIEVGEKQKAEEERKRAEQQKDKGKKSCEQKNIVRLVEISAKTEYTDDGENE